MKQKVRKLFLSTYLYEHFCDITLKTPNEDARYIYSKNALVRSIEEDIYFFYLFFIFLSDKKT